MPYMLARFRPDAATIQTDVESRQDLVAAFKREPGFQSFASDGCTRSWAADQESAA